MPDPVIELVPAAIVAVLGGITSIDGLTVHRNRHEPVQNFPALVLLEGDQDPLEAETGVQRYDLALTLQGFVKVGGAADPGPPLNLLYATALKALKAALNDSLGDVVIDIVEGKLRRLIDPEGDSDRQGQFDLDVIAQVMTAESDPFSLAPQ